MKKSFIIFCLILLITHAYSQEKDYYNNLVDSLLITLSEEIENDLASDGFSIPKQKSRDIQLVGNSMILEIFFTPKCSYILTMFGTTELTYNNFFKQRKGFIFVNDFILKLSCGMHKKIINYLLNILRISS